jgi:hypothetical protein
MLHFLSDFIPNSTKIKLKSAFKCTFSCPSRGIRHETLRYTRVGTTQVPLRENLLRRRIAVSPCAYCDEGSNPCACKSGTRIYRVSCPPEADTSRTYRRRGVPSELTSP